MYTYDNFHKVKEELEAKRRRARAEAEERSAALAEKSPEIAAIDEELRGTGMLIFKTACSGGDIEKIKKRNVELNEKRRKIVLSLGYPEDYTEPKYSCPVCSDVGFIDGVKICSCFRERLFTLNIESSGMGNLITKQSFDNFDLEWYRDDADGYRRMSKTLDTAKKYVADFPLKRGNLLLLGNTGTGKTHISTAIAREIISRGYAVLYDSAENILLDFEADRFKSGYGQHEPKADKYMECDLLIIDDLGAEYVNRVNLSFLYNIINTRILNCLPMIISTNLMPAELEKRYERRMTSRFLGEFSVYRFEGPDMRMMKL